MLSFIKRYKIVFSIFRLILVDGEVDNLVCNKQKDKDALSIILVNLP